ncbi:Asp-tRNA(Asn)/Glu-tRNA(Gln) amidotransferase subunit GatC [Borreliella burgdorferi]|uniref:Asp-tRNA(Asn)/Glu-tRNA(Gln) amidotransferase subunit GatC n=2 Tax=Borreliella burgdorferi TaxID=139 RepID=UPI00017F3FC3|nr:Asp-tRNA(Asn)/Glu-tRNA(Gln) amidotransferase subunit GatC [Borreliella burgdorferi]ADQ29253.1 glutamyl-tRNA(Gln) amidotransferase, C subunit [Borreliella burgdorferi N40]EEH32905.1 glutamyl-tRNA(Gln) amidotransferase, C subunit [Borreliella burgdorferi 29805]MCD2308875.1 Asp-tRNA(Asn)/Glu-tRNA(Gln) amidotransferase subunit GatC [Borreliella burgdorferi]MCD2318082.1 Asp-tRNA(Asn)/Glu-tRNA(Gln) amidotransferase subunit GatC [Borreliella burgdorferi]MCD2319138.1 Asp-tRNA(Asn)/Glu-tRNA(Gln) ami
MKDIHLKNSLKLSLVTLSRESEDKFVSKFEKVIKLVNKISNFEVQINFNANKKKISTLREDEVKFSLSIESIKKLSNSFLDGYFSSPKILE